MAYVVVELLDDDDPQVAGPFESIREAELWAKGEELDTPWVVVDMFNPDE